MTRQLAFELPLRPALGREDFFVSAANAAALVALEGWQSWPGGKTLLIGPPGAGKTHLAHVWAAMASAPIRAALSLEREGLPDLAQGGAVTVEDCHLLGQSRPAQEALFHLHNLLGASGGALLMTAQTPPRDWGLSLADLYSRAQAAPIARLDPPDDALLAAVLVKLFADRQLIVGPTLIPYLVTRMDRSFDAARSLVARLDAEALARGSAITRGLATRMLDNP
jgi:chromosomal replication initiation ATPase DnaA